MGDASRLVEAMMKIAEPKENDIVDMVTGVVTSVNPLKIKTDKIELTETFLIVGALCTATTISIPLRDAFSHVHVVPAHTTGPASVGDHGTHSHEIAALSTESSLPNILLWRGLQVGDVVYMIRCSKGQKYYVMQRKEGIS